MIGRATAVALGVLLVTPAAGQEAGTSRCEQRDAVLDFHCFALWNSCGSLRAQVDIIGESLGFSLDESDVAAVVEARLRASRLFNSAPFGSSVSVSMILLPARAGDREIGTIYAFSVGLEKAFRSEQTPFPVVGFADPWRTTYAGILSRSTATRRAVLDAVADGVDEVLLDYLRVNEPACGGPGER